MPQTNINIRMDEDLKNQFNALCVDLGLTMTAAFGVFAKAAVRQRKIPFEISAESDHPFYSESNQAYLREAVAALNAGKGIIREIIEVEDDE
ncbi:MAG: type II toxin-antitoxin system RelB/DinJ family antitoxin [Oscillospiraceae bacterium]|nr:type II toxin-antitoxin system RelB/DinJ family antitoxin [Oscillospiraceae bacterium]